MKLIIKVNFIYNKGGVRQENTQTCPKSILDLKKNNPNLSLIYLNFKLLSLVAGTGKKTRSIAILRINHY